MPKDPKKPEGLTKYKLDNIDQTILKLRLQYPGITTTELASEVGLERRAVGRRLKRKAYLDAQAEMLLPAKEYLEKACNRLARKYMRLTESNNEIIVERVSRAILTSFGMLKLNPEGDGKDVEPLTIDIPMQGKSIVTVHKKVERGTDKTKKS